MTCPQCGNRKIKRKGDKPINCRRCGPLRDLFKETQG